MPELAYCAVKHEFASKIYQTIWTLHSGVTYPANENTFSEALLDGVGFYNLGVGDLDVRTSTAAEETFAPESLLELIIAFHRYMQGPLVTLKQIYINDGFTLGASTGNFATFDLSLPCENTRLGTTLANYAPANNALMLDKASAVFSRRGGRMYLRGAMQLADIMPSALDGVTLTDGGRSSNSIRVADALVLTGIGGIKLEDFFGDGPPTGFGGADPVQTGIAKTKKVFVDGKERRILDQFTKMQTISVDDAQSRDTRRHNKKAAVGG